jgi:hypothetical protein
MYLSFEASCCSSNLRFSCRITKTQTHNTERLLLLTTMPNISQFLQQCKLYFHDNTQHSVHCRQATSTPTTINKVYCFPTPPTTTPVWRHEMCGDVRWPRSYENDLYLRHIHVKTLLRGLCKITESVSKVSGIQYWLWNRYRLVCLLCCRSQTEGLDRTSLIPTALCIRTQMHLGCLCVLTYIEHISYVNETAAAYSEGLMYKCRSEYLLFRVWYYVAFLRVS